METQFTDVESPEEIRKQKRRRWLLITALLVMLAGTVILFSRCNAAETPAATTGEAVVSYTPPDAEKGLYAAFLDVGQGDCIFLRAPDGKTMLVDAGPDGSFGRIKRFLDREGVKRLDVAVVTHLHNDHIGSMQEVVEHYEIGAFYISPFDIESSAYASLLSALDERGITAVPVYASAVSTLPWSGTPDTEVRVLSPYRVQYEDENDTSIMLRVRFGQTAVLLAGDATTLSERLVIKALKNHALHADVLKVGHHGSASSTSRKFLSVVKPRFAVISVGASNDYDHPSDSVLQKLAEANVTVLRTDLDGTVRILLDGTNVTVIE